MAPGEILVGGQRMTDLTARLAKLGQTVDRKRASQADERARAWAEIQRDAPELASWMQAIH